MRLDKYLTVTALCTRKDAGHFITKGRVTVNGAVVKDKGADIDPEKDAVYCNGTLQVYSRYTYIMVNKPEGVVSATEDKERTVLDLLPAELSRLELFPCGRLDKNTVGLVLLTNDGQLGHRLLSPKSHVSKTYSFKVKFPLSQEDVSALEAGVDIGGYVTMPCKVLLDNEREGYITITEGKYHQIKLMMKSVHNQITMLCRESFGSLKLDRELGSGRWRYLTNDEIEALRRDAEK